MEGNSPLASHDGTRQPMWFRAIVRIDDAGMAVNVGGAVHTEFRVVDFECADLAEVMGAALGSYAQRQIVGVQCLVSADDGSPQATATPTKKGAD